MGRGSNGTRSTRPANSTGQAANESNTPDYKKYGIGDAEAKEILGYNLSELNDMSKTIQDNIAFARTMEDGKYLGSSVEEWKKMGTFVDELMVRKEKAQDFKRISTTGIAQTYKDPSGTLMSTTALYESVAKYASQLRTARSGAGDGSIRAMLKSTLERGRTESIITMYNDFRSNYSAIQNKSYGQRKAMIAINDAVRSELEKRRRTK